MKKIVSFATAILMIVQILALSVTVSALPTSSISISSGEGYEGNTVELSVSIANNTGFGGISINVNFDKNVLEFVGAECKLAGGYSEITPVATANSAASVNLAYVGIANVSANGELFTVSFKIKEGAALGDSALTLVFDDASFVYDGDLLKDFTATVNGGKITVKEKPAGLLGDVNLDGEIDANDLTMLARHVAGIEVLTAPLALSNADINANSDIAADDLTALARHVAGIEHIVQ
ncbi:MAG: hypothetical protein J6S71_02425 [Clostridia bacterium]|nr:hypothetical protein [Clostridia bacterium]